MRRGGKPDRLGLMDVDSELDPGKPGRIVVVGPDGIAESEAADEDGERPVTEMVSQPAKVMRVGSMIGKLLVHYKLAKPDAVRRANSVGGRSTVEKYLKKNKAVLIRKATLVEA